MRITLFISGLSLLVLSGCSVISYNRVFPKLTWYWTDEAKEQRREEKANKVYDGNKLDWQGVLQQSLNKTNK